MTSLTTPPYNALTAPPAGDLWPLRQDGGRRADAIWAVWGAGDTWHLPINWSPVATVDGRWAMARGTNMAAGWWRGPDDYRGYLTLTSANQEPLCQSVRGWGLGPGFTTRRKWGEGSIRDWEYSCCNTPLLLKWPIFWHDLGVWPETTSHKSFNCYQFLNEEMEFYYPQEVMRGEYWGLGAFLVQYSPVVNECIVIHYKCIGL